jgi:dTMP kinase
MQTGKIITFEGGNGSGKNTQTLLLDEFLKQNKFDTHVYHYPEYDSPTGKIITDYLSGKFGPKESLSSFASLMFAADRMKNKSQIESLIESGTIILNNRYTESNWGIQGAFFGDDEALFREIDWMKSLERDLPSSDLVIYLDVPPEISYELTKKRARERGITLDEHERDTDFLEKIWKTYHKIAKKESNWAIIPCVVDGKLRSIESIQSDVRETVFKRVLG